MQLCATTLLAVAICAGAVPTFPPRKTVEYSVSSRDNLLSARDEVRALLEEARVADHGTDVVVELGGGPHKVPATGLSLGPLDSGSEDGHVRVVWKAKERGGASLDGGVRLEGWQLVDEQTGTWRISAPSSLRNPDGSFLPVRQLFVDGVRYNRTRDTPDSFGLSAEAGAVITETGYLTPSRLPLNWNNSTVEIVADFTWVQHRCAVEAVVPAGDQAGSCVANWTTKEPGASPGSAIAGPISANTYEDCQALCCTSLNRLGKSCRAIVYHPKLQQCYLLDRTYESHFTPQADSFVANMNAPPPPPMASNILVARPCWDIARKAGYGQLTFPTFLENTGNLSAGEGEGVWWFDDQHATIWLRVSPGKNMTSSVGVVPVAASLLSLDGAHDITFDSLEFTHATSFQPTQPSGFVERYGNIRFTDVTKRTLQPFPAAVMVSAARRISIASCSFSRLGQWGLRLYNGTQETTVSHCSFTDLSGGAVSVGDVDDSGETNPNRQTATITLVDNNMDGMGREYPGAPAVHSFCMRDSLIAHNRIANVGYTGISYNWPNPQGPTWTKSTTVGYSANNAVLANDISAFMSYMNDGGGIHTIGRAYNTSVAANYFHDLAAGRPGAVSTHAQSVLYVDNWSCFITLESNVVVNCPATQQGPYYFQHASLGLAHDDAIAHLYLVDAGHLSGRSEPCNCTGVVNATSVADLPPQAQRIIAAAGPRP